MSILLSEQHGVNPSIEVCFWCGEDRGGVVLFGRLKDDQAAPRRACVSYEPCKECQGQMDRGITLIAVDPEDDHTPTGPWAVLTEDAVRRLLRDSPENLQAALTHRKVLMHPLTFSFIMENYNG